MYRNSRDVCWVYNNSWKVTFFVRGHTRSTHVIDPPRMHLSVAWKPHRPYPLLPPTSSSRYHVKKCNEMIACEVPTKLDGRPMGRPINEANEYGNCADFDVDRPTRQLFIRRLNIVSDTE